MKDKELREQLIKTGIVDEDLWVSPFDKQKLENAYKAGDWMGSGKKRMEGRIDSLLDRITALVEALGLEEVYIDKKPSKYKYQKVKKVKK